MKNIRSVLSFNLNCIDRLGSLNFSNCFYPFILNFKLFNARSLFGKETFLISYLKNFPNHIFCITETFLTAKKIPFCDNSVLVGDSNFILVRADRSNAKKSRGGGVCAFIPKHFPFTLRKTPSVKNIDYLVLDIFFGTFSFTLIVSYIPPDTPPDTVRDFCETLLSLKLNSSNILLLGDFNMPDIDWEGKTSNILKEKLFLDFLFESELSNSISIPTRKENILDLVISNFSENVYNISTDPGFYGSDHDIVNFSLKCSDNPPPKPSLSFKNFKKADFLSMDIFFFDQNWDFLNQKNITVDSACTEFCKIVNEAISLFVETVTPSSEERFSAKMRSTIEFQKSLPKTAENFKTISLISKKLNKLSIQEKREKEKTILKKYGTKGIFNHLGKYLKKDSSIPAITTVTKTLFSDTEKTAAFGENFLNNFHSEKSPFFEDCFPVKDSALPFLTVEQVKEFLQKLKPKCNTSPDGIPYIVLKKCFSSLAKPITKIINLSFLQNQVPEIWKVSHVIPVFKKGDKHLASNYRPISLNCSLSMIPQKIVIDFLNDFFSKNNLIPSCQHGFTKSKSVTTQLVETFDFLTTSAEKNIPVDIIYFDVKKAFDRLKHILLFRKLKKAKVPNSIIAWIQAFLSNRKFRVKIGESLSEYFDANSGVPQGSKIGPLLFLFFVADLISSCETPEVVNKLFADDLKALSSNLSFTDPPLQTFLGKLEKWMEENELEIATEKCNVLHCLPDKNPRISYFLNNQKLPNNQNSVRDLGLIVSDDLSWKNHIKIISKKALARLFILFKALKSNSSKLLLHMYHTYVRPLVEFSTPVFNPTEVYLIDKLEKVQKVAVKNIFLRSPELRPHFNAPYEQKLEMLGIESLESRRNKFDLIFLNDYLSGKVTCKLDLSVRNSITRGSNKKIELPNSKKVIKRNFFTFRTASKYIKLPRNLQYTQPKLFKQGIMALKV